MACEGGVPKEVLAEIEHARKDPKKNIVLQEIFRYNREFLTRPISNAGGSAGDILTLVAESIADSGNTVNGSLTWGER